MTPKEECRAALLALREQVMSPEPMDALGKRLAAASLDYALECVDKLTVARPRKNGEA